MGISGGRAGFGFLGSDLGMVAALTLAWGPLEAQNITFFSPKHIAYCQVSAGRGSEERPTGFPPGLERLLQNGKLPEGGYREAAETEVGPASLQVKDPPLCSLECGQTEQRQ